MRKLAQSALLLGAITAALAFGGMEPITFSLVQLLLFVSTAVLLLWYQPALDNCAPRVWMIPGVLLSLSLLQLLPVGTLHDGNRALTASRAATSEFLLWLLAATCAFFLTLVAGHEGKGRETIVKTLVTLGLFEAFYGLVQYLTGWQKIFTYVKKYNLEQATGTYINRNHYAGLLEMLIPLALAMALHYAGWLDATTAGQAKGFRGWMRDPRLQRAPFWLFVGVILFLALVFSGSRMGILSAILSALVMLALLQLRANRSRRGLLIPLILLAAGIAMAVWIGPGPVLTRFSQMDAEYAASPTSRVNIWRDTLGLIRQHPLLGTGLGTFPIVYTQVQTAFLTQFVNSAHNDYLEYASDLGVPAAALFFGGIVWLLLRLGAFASRAKGDTFDCALAIGCAGSIAALLLHSFTDFNLRIPANLMIFTIVLGLACSLVYPKIAKPEMAS
jgi:O-antigen ligase